MPTRRNIQYTLRGIPADVDRALRKKARDRKISLNKLLVEELIHASGAAPVRKYRSLADIAGQWKEDPEFDRALEAQRQIDWDMWR
jgi:hypothetical protein